MAASAPLVASKSPFSFDIGTAILKIRYSGRKNAIIFFLTRIKDMETVVNRRLHLRQELSAEEN